MSRLLCPSMMCADCGILKQEVLELEKAGIDVFHIDIMDGNFIPTFGMGLQDVEAICSISEKAVDVHLMTENPVRHIKNFIDMGVDIIYIHPEVDKLPVRTLQLIKTYGGKAGLVLSPQVIVESMVPLLSLADYVLVMTVSPGFAGQKYLEFVNTKIKQLVLLASQYHYKVIIDGACSLSKIKELSKLNVDGFVLGTSVLFNKAQSYKEIVETLRKI
ncbi:ribulose-phosphate 3-epimerase [Pectinatus frisingensis]|uniref:ribulose-phosphate 3-epimerase n=1 Tax=Pectinatus frisingensis TaxID=865 RepID=UPI0018C46CBF|nr:ribulose-phosphate 3-epimerase [Pectinatus frisingensis]